MTADEIGLSPDDRLYFIDPESLKAIDAWIDRHADAPSTEDRG